MALIQVNNLSFAYNGQSENKVLNNLSFNLEAGTITAVIGLSGCGKTTLCHCLCGIIPNAVEGHIKGDILIENENIKGKSLSKLAPVIGLVMQNPDDQLVCTTVEDEIAFAMENLAYPPDEIRARVEEILKFMNLECHRHQNPNRLSGGQKQLVSVAAVLALNPEILIFDEPMSHLDDYGRGLITDIIKHLKKAGKTIIVVEHNFRLLDFADNWLLLENGNLKALDTPQNIKNGGLLLKEMNLV